MSFCLKKITKAKVAELLEKVANSLSIINFSITAPYSKDNDVVGGEVEGIPD